ncbi:MAG TPA: response regulator [Chloroflexota bacterium]|jgi:twitching motility two-component system response regulator PilG|nr:response regulator [Chloroflexota bacterium]
MPEQPYTVLIVEDSATMRYAYNQALEERYTLIFADNPLSALTEVATRRPDIVLLDINLRAAHLPAQQKNGKSVRKHMDGLDVCAAIKRSPYKDIPVIMLTGRDGLIDKVRGKLARADCYLTKPVDSVVLLAKIREYLSPRIVSQRLQTELTTQVRPRPRLRR